MKKISILLLLAVLFASCSSDDEDSQDIKNNLTVELSDIKGEWTVTAATDGKATGIRLVLKDDMYNSDGCSWTDKRGNFYVGPLFKFYNVNDDILKRQASLLASEVNDEIHIGSANVRKYVTEESNYTEVYRSELVIVCDLKTLLPSLNWEYFSEKVDRETWYFWEYATFTYTFNIEEYTESRMKLRLTSSNTRYKSDRFPLRLKDNTELTLQRQ